MSDIFESREFVSTMPFFTEISDSAVLTIVPLIADYFTFGETKERYDITLLFNVLHHLGDDYGDGTLSMYDTKIVMIKQLNSLSKNTDILVF